MLERPTIPLIDTNILISFFTVDAHTQQAQALFQKHPCYLNHFVLAETSNFLLNKYSSSLATGAIRMLLASTRNFRFLDVPDILLLKAHDIMVKFSDNALSFTDCVLLAQGEHHKIPVLTCDLRMQNYKNTLVSNPFQG
jgi:predicted nucleic acid-binding protein